MAKVHHRACNLCEAICGLEIAVGDDGRIASIRGDEKDPLSRGHICPKAVALKDIHEDPDRLRHPELRKSDGSWQRIPWDEAFDLAVTRLREVQREYGDDSVAVYSGNPTVHNYGSLLYGPPLLHALKTRSRYSATSSDQLPHHLVSYWMLGHMLLLPVPDLEATAHLLVFGGNPAVSNGSMMTAPDVKKRLKEIRARGGKVVVVDPRRSETAALADEHVFVRPGADAFLLLAMLATLFEEGLDRPGRLASFTRGYAELRTAALEWKPEAVEAFTGVPAEIIRRLARELAAAPRAAVYGRIGVSVQEFGGLCQWAIYALNLVTGNLDRRGGVLFPTPAIDLLEVRRGRGSFGRWRSKVRGLPEAIGELPVATLAEDILDENPPHLRALVTMAGNPVLSSPNGRQLEEALARLEFMVAIDYYRNETTRFADLILPPTAALEHDHYDLVFHALAVRNTARYSPPLFAPAEDTRHDWQILHQLHRRLEPSPGLRGRLFRGAAGRLGPRGLLALLLRFGRRGAKLWPFSDGLSLARLEAAPSGVDLGPLEESLLPGRLRTRDRKIDAAPAPLLADLGRLRARAAELRAAAESSAPLLLIGRRQLQSNNSWMHNSERLLRGKERCTLLVNPADAAARGIAGGSAVVRSRVGEVVAPVELTEDIMPGVVSLPHGWGHRRPGVQLREAAKKPGVSLNDLTDDQRVDALCGTAAFSAVPVELAPVEVAPVEARPGEPAPVAVEVEVRTAGG